MNERQRHVISRVGLTKISGHLISVAIKKWLSETWMKNAILLHSRQNIHLLLEIWARTLHQQLNLNYIEQTHHTTSWFHEQQKYFASVRFWAQIVAIDWLFQWRSLQQQSISPGKMLEYCFSLG